MSDGVVRLGMLGAAKIGRWGLVKPARKLPGVRFQAVAARDPRRAERYARRHRILQTFATYDALLASDAVDAVYNPLPNGLHHEWTMRALEAGKHVLCEKPLAANAREVDEMIVSADSAGLVLMEAMHYRFHPLTDQVLDAAGSLGSVSRIESTMRVPIPSRSDIRFSFELGGGALMDTGAYTADLLLALADATGVSSSPSDIPEVSAAKAVVRRDGIDDSAEIDLRWSNGTAGHMSVSLRALVPRVTAKVVGSRGELRVTNPYLPHLFHRVVVVRDGHKTRLHVRGRTSYDHQLEEFVRRIHAPNDPHPLSRAPRSLKLIDASYRAAGLPVRGNVRGSETGS